MRKPLWIIAFVLVLSALAALWAFQRRPLPAAEALSHEHSHDREAENSNNSSSSEPSRSSLPTPSGAGQDPSEGALTGIPGDSTSTASLIAYAELLAPKMDAAEKNLEKAREFMSELETCVLNPDSKSGASIQALCLATAEELSDIHAELSERFKTLRQNASPNLTRILEEATAED